MNIGYIDTSFLLSILFEDENYTTTVNYWNNLDILFSSILLEIESGINVYKYYMQIENNEVLYREKEKQRLELLENINRKIIDNEIVLEIKNTEKLKLPKSFNSIHLATASIFNKFNTQKLLLCSYDKNMRKIGKELGLQLIQYN